MVNTCCCVLVVFDSELGVRCAGNTSSIFTKVCLSHVNENASCHATFFSCKCS